jgi:hypothetical protein
MPNNAFFAQELPTPAALLATTSVYTYVILRAKKIPIHKNKTANILSDKLLKMKLKNEKFPNHLSL